MQPQRLSTSCDHHPEEQFIGICPSCLRERLITLGHKSLSFFHRSMTSSLPPLSLNPHRLSTSCDRHPEEQFIGFCPSCLYERLTILKSDSSSSIYKRPITSTVTASPKAISRSFTTTLDANRLPESSSFTFQPKLRRTKSCPLSKMKAFLAPSWPIAPFFSIFNQDNKHEIPIKEPKVETRNLASSSIIQNRVQESVKEEPRIELEVDVEVEKTQKAMEDHMDIDSQAKKSSSRDLKECIWFPTSIFKKKFQKWRQKQKMKKRE